MQPRHCLEKVVPQNCPRKGGRREKRKGQGSLEGATELMNINYINMHNTALAPIKGSTTEFIFKNLFYFNSSYIFTDIIKIIF